MFEQITAALAANPETAALAGIFVGLIISAIIVGFITYVYTALTMMFTAQRLKIENPWLAWIPVANLVLMSKMAKMHWWPVLLSITLFIPFVNLLAAVALSVFYIIWLWKICEFRKREGWWAILILIPFFGIIWQYIVWGILAWSKE